MTSQTDEKRNGVDEQAAAASSGDGGLRPASLQAGADAPEDEEMPAALREDDKAFSTQILQFFLFPLLIVIAMLAVFILFGVSSASRSSVEDLLFDLRHGSSFKRDQAAHQLAKKFTENPELAQDPEVADSLLDILATRTELTPEMRQFLLLAGARTGDRRFTPIVLSELDEFYGRSLQEQAEQEESEVRLYVALELLRDPGIVEPLKEYFERDSEATRKLVLQALDPVDTPEVTELLLRALEDEYVDVRWNAALKLAARRHPAAVPVIEKMLDRDYVESAPEIRPEQIRTALDYAARAAATLKSPQLLPALEELASDEDARVAAAARAALREYEKSGSE